MSILVSPAVPARWTGAAAGLLLMVAGAGLFFLICTQGDRSSLPQASLPQAAGDAPASRATPGQARVMLHVIATLAAVVFVGLVLGRALRYIGQPPVIGEVLAGIVLGPSVLGAISPEALTFLVPSSDVDPKGHVSAALWAMSQLGVILYMFLVGMELDSKHLARRAGAAAAISQASIVVPFVLGAALALGLYPAYSHSSAPFISFALFMGVATATTAFPVLARILTDRKLEKTELGAMALSCSAAGDVAAWCLLALVVGVARADVGAAVWVIGEAAAFITLIFLVVRPLLKRVIGRQREVGALDVSAAFLAVLAAAFTTEAIGIHAVFGAFLLGVAAPHDSRLARELSLKLKDVVTVLLLPAFFAYTGMRTQINLVSGWEDWLWCGIITAAATAGKFGGTFAAARLTGSGWREAGALGALMNSRGLMELIVLNIGLDLGVISPRLFAMMVIMALATTMTTTPVVAWLTGEERGESSEE